jgi:hypothetical protein
MRRALETRSTAATDADHAHSSSSACTLQANDAVAGRTVAIALVVLQLLAATNHAVAAIQSHAMLNAIMSVVNYGCVVFGIFALRGGRMGQV